MKAVILFSGGVDSTVVLALAKQRGLEPIALSFDYGQRHKVELEAAKKIAKHFAVEHKIIVIDPKSFGKSSLVGEGDVPKGEIPQGITSTYVPARNTLFLTFALVQCEILDGEEIHIGANFDDQNGYPDCRPEFFEAFSRVATLGTKAGVEGKSIRVVTPLIHLSKGEIFALGRRLSAPLELTWSCYDPLAGPRPCSLCLACLLRQNTGLPSQTLQIQA